VDIRKATPGDYNAVMELYNSFIGEDRYSQHDGDSFQKVLENPRCQLFVAETEAGLIGFASVSTRDVVRYKQPIAELDELFVSPEARTHGTGRALMEAVEAFAGNQNCYRLFIESAYQHTAGHAFYEKLGYKNNGYHFIKNI
jgi:GNAT superfamily N-acetyltransferase